jgi:dipeptidyl aminopeptidase/acylaminoacyl peptidase
VAPEVLARYAPTPLDPKVSRHLENLLDVRSPGLGILSPDGKHLFFSWTVTGISQIWRLDGPNAFPVQMTGGEDQTFLSDITPDGKTLVLGRDRKGEENPGIYLQDASGGALRPVQHKDGVQSRFQFLSEDGKWLYFVANDVKPDSYVLYRYEMATGKREAVFGEPGIWTADDHRGSKILLAKHTGSLSVEYSELDLETKAVTPLFGQGETEEYQAAYASRPGDVLVLTPKFSEFRQLHRFSGGHFTAVSPASLTWDVSSFSIDEARRHILYEVNEGGSTRLFALDAGSLAPIPLPDFGSARHVFAGSSTRDGSYSALGVGTDQAPRASYVYDWARKTLVQWVFPSAPEVDLKRFAVAKLEEYPARDGTKIPMFVRRPESPCKGPCPVVVEFHGGPEGQSQPGFSPFAQAFVDAGFVYVEPNVRGSDGYGKTWLNADNGPKRLHIITDIEDCARFIRANWGASATPPRIGIFGGSYGGYSALIGMTMFAGTYDAGVSIVGISNLVTFLNNTAPYRRALRISEYGDPVKDKDALVALSPVTYLDRVKGPILLIAGASDPRVPVGEAIQFHDALEARKIAAPLVIFPDEGHGAAKRENIVQELGQSLLFLEQHLVEAR